MNVALVSDTDLDTDFVNFFIDGCGSVWYNLFMWYKYPIQFGKSLNSFL
jgi:hypothetical protein